MSMFMRVERVGRVFDRAPFRSSRPVCESSDWLKGFLSEAQQGSHIEIDPDRAVAFALNHQQEEEERWQEQNVSSSNWS